MSPPGTSRPLNLLGDENLFFFSFDIHACRTSLLPQSIHQCVKNGLQRLRVLPEHAFQALAIYCELTNLAHPGQIQVTA